MSNLYRLFRKLIPDAPLLVGEVTDVRTGGCVVELPDGGTVFARGDASLTQKVFVRDGVIEGVAPSLAIETIEV